MDLKFLRRHTPRNVTMLSDKNLGSCWLQLYIFVTIKTQ